MKIYCKYSGAVLTSRQFPTLEIKHHHPIMEVSPRLLLSLVSDYRDNKMSDEEKRLYFIALLNSTDHVIFKTYARPTLRVVLRNLDSLIKCLGWMSVMETANPVYLSLPKYAITNSTADLSNIHLWITSWNEIKNEWALQSDISYIRRRLRLREEALDKILRSPYLKLETMVNPLMKWAFIVAEVPFAERERWMEIAQVTNKSLDKIPQEEIERMIDYFAAHEQIVAGEIRSHALLKHLRDILQRKTLGVYRSMADLGYSFTEISTMMNQTFRIVSGDQIRPVQELTVEDHNKATLAMQAPELEPKESQIGTLIYPTRVSWLVALNRWRLKQSLLNGAFPPATPKVDPLYKATLASIHLANEPAEPTEPVPVPVEPARLYTPEERY